MWEGASHKASPPDSPFPQTIVLHTCLPHLRDNLYVGQLMYMTCERYIVTFTCVVHAPAQLWGIFHLPLCPIRLFPFAHLLAPWFSAFNTQRRLYFLFRESNRFLLISLDSGSLIIYNRFKYFQIRIFRGFPKNSFSVSRS